MKKKYHIVPSTGEAKPCQAEKSCKYSNSIHGESLEETIALYEDSMNEETIPNVKKKKKNEFDTINNSFPSPEIISKYFSIVQKYGADNLQNFSSLVDHDELFNNPSELFLLYSFMNAQQKSSSIEKFISKKLGGEKVKSSEDRGDAKINNDYYELKTSTTNQGDNLNIRQIRLYQDVDYYVCSYIYERDLEKSKTYILTKEEMKEEVDLIGTFTHGTKKANDNKSNPEYSVTISMYNDDNEHTKRWNEKYWYNDLYDVLTEQENQ